MEKELEIIREQTRVAKSEYEYYKEKFEKAKASYDGYTILLKFLENKYESQTKKDE